MTENTPSVTNLKAIAFHLPQFHPIRENDEWWGKGFTEWTNVTKARAGFKGHYQPHLPADLGFCDLRLPEVRSAQAELASEFGVHGFCYYHYWFNGRRVLERPVNEILASGEPDFPFCLCWANENWTRIWDGQDRQVLLKQSYSDEDDKNHIRSLVDAFSDDRYIRVNGKPLFLVYRASALPEAKRTTDTWRNEAQRLGLGELHLCRVESFHTDKGDPKALGFDAAVEFAPDWECAGPILNRSRIDRLIARIWKSRKFPINNFVRDYKTLADNMLAKPAVDYTRYRCVTPMWDNSARRDSNASVFKDSTPEIYRNWLKQIALQASRSTDRIFFINAWNEWAEGNHLEPCQRWGRAYLEATREVLEEIEIGR